MSASRPRCGFADLANKGYQYEFKNGHHNYHFTAANFQLPPHPDLPACPLVLKGFAPNLNKKLHIGHLKNLAAANALTRILKCKPVAMLGASLGVLPGALPALMDLFEFVGYDPQVTLDIDLPPGLVPTSPGSGAYAGCRVYYGPLGPVVVIKTDGKPTYAYHDLAYAELVKPDYYITGCEQKEHFASLGLAEKHLAMGLVLGLDGKKIKSSGGNPLLAEEAFDLVIAQLDPTPEPEKLAWNVLAYTFLQASMGSNNKFDPVQMTKPTSPGLYLTYTLAKVHSALSKAGVTMNMSNPTDLSNCDVALLGLAAYSPYYLHLAQEAKDPAPLANYLLTLAKGLAKVYAKQSIKHGSPGLKFAVLTAFKVLREGFIKLGLFPLLEV